MSDPRVTSLIGNTPLVRLPSVEVAGGAAIFGKLESANPGGSVKDRIALAMIERAEADGSLRPGMTIVEPTSGNTGIGLALVASVRGYKLVLTMPDDMNLERRTLLSLFGATLELTPAIEGMSGSVFAAEQLARERGYFMPQQFLNPANPDAHRRGTGPEIVRAVTAMNRRVDAFVAGVGTGGTITGVGEIVKATWADARIVALEPARAAVLSGGRPGIHRIHGIGAGFVPGVLNRAIIDQVLTVTDEDAYEAARRLARDEGLLVGISAGANVWAAAQVARGLSAHQTVVTILCDTGERYLSMAQTFRSG
ncbi:MAG: cysteine synthase A [Chloroflexi bacterium]|nr:cysteine synthase A [Chloroflexota bacterium]